MNWIKGLIYGLVSGITEFLPVSSQPHQRILLQLFGTEKDPICDLIVHLSSLVALYIACRGLSIRMRREQQVRHHRKRSHFAETRVSYDLRLIRTAIAPMLLTMLLMVFTRTWVDKQLLMAVFALLSGVIIFIAERFPHGNKDSRYMSVLDAVVFGIAGGLSVFPGLSRVGTSMSYAAVRGVEKQQSINWTLLLSIPALIILSIFDVVGIATASNITANISVILGYIAAGVGAFAGTYLCVFFIRTVLSRANMASFAYYSWGISMLLFVLYLIS